MYNEGRYRNTVYRGNLIGFAHYNYRHRIPNWMPFKLHLIVEDMLDEVPKFLVRSLLGIPYHIAYGVICGYSGVEILSFFKEILP